MAAERWRRNQFNVIIQRLVHNLFLKGAAAAAPYRYNTFGTGAGLGFSTG